MIFLRLENKIAAAIAHRVCHSAEHDPEHGKLHGYCIVCGLPWPCETAKTFLFTNLIRRSNDHMWT